MNRRFELLLTGILLFLLLPVGAAAKNGLSSQELFFEANRAYKNGQFQEAAEGYLKLMENGVQNGHLYFNLGNAYFRLGELGRAILFYERARLLIPRNDDLVFNLSHAKKQAQDATDDLQTALLGNFLGLDSVNLHETFMVFSLLNLLFFATLAIRRFKRPEWTYYAAIFLAILLGIGAGGFALKWYAMETDDRAVVLAKELDVRAGPAPGDTVLFKIHEGTLVHYQRAEDGWVLLHLSKDKRGWAESAHLERVVANPDA